MTTNEPSTADRPPQPVQTFAAVVAWLDANYKPPHSSNHPARANKDNAMWFFAMREAEMGGYSEMRLKDIASLVLTGLPPLTIEGIAEQLVEEVGEHAEFAEGNGVGAYDLTDELRAFFWGVTT